MINLIWINLIVALVYMSGFWTVLDDEISKRFKFHHLPHLLFCGLCQCWWLSLLYIIVTGHFTLLGIVLCLINAHLIEITIPLLTVVKNWLLKIIEKIMPI